MRESHSKGLPRRPEIISRGPKMTLTEPIVSWVQAPPPTKPIYREKTVTPAMPLATIAESGTKPASIVPVATMGGGN